MILDHISNVIIRLILYQIIMFSMGLLPAPYQAYVNKALELTWSVTGTQVSKPNVMST